MNKYSIPNLVKACHVMKSLADRPNGISAVQVERLFEVPRTTAFRILKTLCSQDIAEKRGTLFFAGPALVQVGLNSLKSMEIRTLCIPFLSELAQKSGFTAHIAVPCGLQSLILEVHDSPNPVRVASRSGTAVPLYCSSTGKVFLAYLFEDNLDEYFSSVQFHSKTPHTIITVDAMRQEIECIRRQGYAVDNQEFHEDVYCLAAPVRNSQGQVVAAMGITGPVVSFTDDKRQSVCDIVKDIAGQLSAALGYEA